MEHVENKVGQHPRWFGRTRLIQIAFIAASFASCLGISFLGIGEEDLLSLAFENASVVETSDIKFDHDLHKGLEVKCNECHDPDLKVENAKYPGYMMTMESCEGCHEKNAPEHENLKDECTLCHSVITDESKPKNHDENWTEKGVHSWFRDEEHFEEHRCNLCHEEEDTKWCTDCHSEKKPAYHGGEFPNNHGPSSAEEEATCRFCHSGDEPETPGVVTCEECHQSTKPANHSANWTNTHGGTGTTSFQSCDTCHRGERECRDCHRNEAPRDHTSVWRREVHGRDAMFDTSRCENCHRQDECLRCHQFTEPRSHNSSSWASGRSRHCVSCHEESIDSTECFACHRTEAGHTSAPARPLNTQHSPGNDCRSCHGVSVRFEHYDNGSDCLNCHSRSR
ncbi:MAG: hypothetical protein NUW37_02415 [Planctomycetes bacterium]|nr:hypothetical protein [Planctomycetota bacterium]